MQLKEDIGIKSSPIFHEYGREREGLGIHRGHSLNKFEFEDKKFPLNDKIFHAAESVMSMFGRSYWCSELGVVLLSDLVSCPLWSP